jgi:hypothetical protein
LDRPLPAVLMGNRPAAELAAWSLRCQKPRQLGSPPIDPHYPALDRHAIRLNQLQGSAGVAGLAPTPRIAARTVLACNSYRHSRPTSCPWLRSPRFSRIDPQPSVQVVSYCRSRPYSGGSPGNCLAFSGMHTPASLRAVQICVALDISIGTSKQPALIVTVSDAASLSCQSREPQLPQNTQLRRRPLSVARGQLLGSPDSSVSPARGTWSEMPNAEADCFWHSWQWQIYSALASPRLEKRIAPHWHPPRRITVACPNIQFTTIL